MNKSYILDSDFFFLWFEFNYFSFETRIYLIYLFYYSLQFKDLNFLKKVLEFYRDVGLLKWMDFENVWIFKDNGTFKFFNDLYCDINIDKGFYKQQERKGYV